MYLYYARIGGKEIGNGKLIENDKVNVPKWYNHINLMCVVMECRPKHFTIEVSVGFCK